MYSVYGLVLKIAELILKYNLQSMEMMKMNKVLLAVAIFMVVVAVSSAKRHPIWRAHTHGTTAGARPDLHWGDRDLFHGDFSVDESQLGGKIVVFKVSSAVK